jgi:hypothetical protein
MVVTAMRSPNYDPEDFVADFTRTIRHAQATGSLARTLDG